MRLPLFHIAAVVLASLFSLTAQADPLELSLEPGSVEGTVQVSITNTGSTTLSVLRWDTPFEEILSSDVFHVERPLKGWPLMERAVYVGREVKRAEPGEDQYLVLEPGTTISQSVELNDYYRIDKADTRIVRFAGPVHYSELNPIFAKGTDRRNLVASTLTTTLTSALSSAVLESNSVQVNVAPQLSSRVLTPAYNDCSAQEQTDIVAAARLAENYVSTAIADLQSLAVDERSDSPRYTTWFGAATEVRFSRVLSNFVAIGDALEEEQIRFDCGCSENGVYAYVYSSRPYDIFLCPAFRAASPGGTDSRAGTIIHELSHFTILADTDDHVYSQRGAQSLATTDPDQAITNADSHEYFAENTPELAIRGMTDITEPLEHEVLVPGTPVSGSVTEDSSVTYQVSGAGQITLTSLSGDADLYLYSDPALTAESCNSSSSSAPDVCETFSEGTVYIRVFGYTSASYTLEATPDDASTPPVATATLLTLNTSVSGVLEKAERRIYEVSGAELVNLESLSGDADLYIFDSMEFTDASFICASAEFSSDSTMDSCTLPSSAITYYVLIVGYTLSEYSLIAISNTADPDQEPAVVDMGRLVVGETVSEAVVSGQIHQFVVSGAASVELTSLTGDADLSVYATSDFEDSGLLCVSAQNSADSAMDSCDIPSGTDHYVEILGFEDSTYALVAASVPEDDAPVTQVPTVDAPATEVPTVEVPVEVPVEPQAPDDAPEPDATPVASSGARSGIGSFDFTALGLLMLTVACRRSIKRRC